MTSNIGDIGLYNLRLTGNLGNYTEESIDFDVNIYACSEAIITPVSVSDYEYTILISGVEDIVIPEWSESTNLCGPFTYNITCSPSASFVDFTSQIISIYSDELNDVGDYLITITGTLPNGKSS